MDSRGFDSTGREFSSATEMWAQEIGATASASASASEVPPGAAAAAAAPSNGDAGEEAGGEGKREEWYSKGIAYWQVNSKEHPRSAAPP